MNVADDDLIPLSTEDTRAIAVTAKVHADQLDGELQAVRERVTAQERQILELLALVGAIDQRVRVLDAFVASIQKMLGAQG